MIRKCLTIGTYSYQDRTYHFCLYDTSTIPCLYRLRDVDVLFFQNSPGYVLDSAKVRAEYLKSPQHREEDEEGDVYLSATALGDTAKRLGNYLLSEFCTLPIKSIASGLGNELLKSLKTLSWEYPFDDANMSKVEPMDVSPRDDQESPSRVLHRSPEPLGGDSGRRLRDHSKKSSIDMLIDGNSGPDSERTGDGYADGSPLKRNRVEPESALVADQQGGSSGQGSPTDEQPARPKQRKRLSINTSVGPNHPGRASAPVGGTGPTSASVNADVMEQMRNTLKLKQQQQAIIEARQSAQIMNRGPMSAEPRGLGGRGAQSASLDPPHLPLHPFRNRGGSPSGVHSSPRQGSTRSSGKGSARVPESSRFSHLSSTSGQPVASPITQFPSRELPLPPHLQTERYSTHAAGGEHDGPRSPHPALTSLHSSKQNLPPPSPATAYPMHHVAPNVPLSRSAFLSFAEHFYDIHEESTRLVATLRDQIRRSTAMLQTLQASGQMIEGLVRSHFREMQVGYGERFGAALTDLNRRLSTLEERSGISSEAGTNAGVNWGFRGAPPSATPGGAAAAGFPIRDRDGQDAGDSRSVNGDRLAQDTIKVLLERVERLESAAKPSQKNRASSSEGEGEEE